MAKTQQNYDVRFDVMGLRKAATFVSAALIIISIAALVIRGLNFGIDFTGGYIVEAGFEQPASLPEIRSALSSTTTEVMVRLAPAEGLTGARVNTEVDRVLASVGQGEVTMRRVEFVGPQVGEVFLRSLK